MQRFLKDKLSLFFICIIAFIFMFSMAFMISDSFASATENSESIGKLRIGHISDLHYFPIEYCQQENIFDDESHDSKESGTYSAETNPYSKDYTNSDFYNSMTGDTKLVVESGVILHATIRNIIADAKTGTAPIVFVASGDLSKNGERVALIDVANALRFLQNEVRKFNDYANFQVLAVPGNHDLYNGQGEVYKTNNGDAYNTDGVTAEQYALIFAGLGYPDANLDGTDGAVKLTDFYEANYFYSDYTGGYVPSSNTSSITFDYFDKALATKDYVNIGHGNNVLSFTAQFQDNSGGYSIMMIDSTDRLKTSKLVPVRISQNTFMDNYSADDNAFSKGSFHLEESDGSIALEPIAQKDKQIVIDAFNNNKHVYFNIGIDHVTGGRITTECLNWLKEYTKTQKLVNPLQSNDIAEETYIAVFHHNALPHFEQEDDILKDFTLYNWEYTVKELLKMGVRYTLTGHMHSSDVTNYTDAAGRTLFDLQIGSSVSYDSPRRYVTIERQNCDGKLGEIFKSELMLLGKLSGYASSNITAAKVWNENNYKTTNTFAENLAVNPDYFTMVLFHKSFTDKSYNNYINDEIYSKLIERMLGHFLNDNLVDTLSNLVSGLLVGKDNALSKIPKIGVILSGHGVTINKIAQYAIDTIFGTNPAVEGLYGANGYPYKGNTYANGVLWLKAIVNDVVSLSFGDEALGKLNIEQIASFIMVSHNSGMEISLDEVIKDIDKDSKYYVKNSPTDPIYRARFKAALNDFLNQCTNGELIKNLLGTLLDPILINENSLLKTLLAHKFDLSKIEWAAGEIESLDTIIEVANTVLPSIIGGKITIDPRNLVLGDIATQLMPLLGGLLSDSLGIKIVDNDIIATLNGFLDSYLVDSFYVGIGGIARNIVEAFATDKTADTENMYDPSIPFIVVPHAEYGKYARKQFTYISSFAMSDKINVATQDNGRIPSRVTANFDTTESTTSFKISFYTAEDVFGTFRWSDDNGATWKEVKTTAFDNMAKVVAGSDKFYSATASNSGATIFTESKPQYIPLIDLGLLCISHAAVDFEVKVGNDKIVNPYTALDRDNAEKNSVIFWNRHIVTITGLNPNTTYLYDIAGNYTLTDNASEDFTANERNNGDSNQNVKDFNLSKFVGVSNFTFKTALGKNADTFDFLAIADIQGMIEGMYSDSFVAFDALQKNTATNGYDFILNAGDMCDNGKNFYQWGNALNTYQSAFANTSMFMTAGNHEKGSNAMNNFFNYKQPTAYNNQSGIDGLAYSFDYGNAHFVVLNTNDTTKKGLGDEQVAWLRSDLNRNKSKWTFVLMHKSLFSGGAHSEDADVIAMRKQLVPIFNRYGVNMVFAGHDHSYTTTQLIGSDGKAINESISKDGEKYSGNGVLFVTLGTMGTKFYEYTENNLVTPYLDNDNSVLNALDSQTFGYVQIAGDLLTYKGYSFNKQNNELTEISNIKLSNKTDIVVESIKNKNIDTKTKYSIGFFESKLSTIDYDSSAMPNDCKLVFLANGKEYGSIDQIKLTSKSTDVKIVFVEKNGSRHELQIITIAKENYALAISLLTIGFVAIVGASVAIAIFVTKKRKRA